MLISVNKYLKIIFIILETRFLYFKDWQQKTIVKIKFGDSLKSLLKKKNFHFFLIRIKKVHFLILGLVDF